MKKTIQKREDDEILKEYPIADRVPGWFFRQEELSAACWVVEGTDRWGCQVHRRGMDPDDLMTGCVGDAQRIEERLQKG